MSATSKPGTDLAAPPGLISNDHSCSRYSNALQGNPPYAPSTPAPMANAEIIRATA